MKLALTVHPIIQPTQSTLSVPGAARGLQVRAENKVAASLALRKSIVEEREDKQNSSSCGR